MRIRSLDSLRGIAALVVVLYHAALVFPEGSISGVVYLTPLRFLIAGPAAVLLFFVLSGVVLTMASVHKTAERYDVFLIKRFFRIWPPFAIAIGLSAMLAYAIGANDVPGTSNWFAYTWSDSVGPIMIVRHLAMTGSTTTLDNPMWSLIHELRVSVIFPFLVYLCIRSRKLTVLASVFVMFACVKLPSIAAFPFWIKSASSTGVYLFLFVSGIVIALQFDKLSALLKQQRPSTHVLLWIFALVALACTPSRTDAVDGFRPGAELLLGGLGASLIVMLCAVEGRVFTALMGDVPIYLGRISYSLYLIHVVVIAAVLHSTSELVSLQMGVIAAIALSIALADVAQRFIEVPSIAVGKRILGRLHTSRAAADDRTSGRVDLNANSRRSPSLVQRHGQPRQSR